MSPRWLEKAFAILCAFTVASGAETNLPVINGQVLTNGLSIIDSPQPDTPLGGDTLEIAIEVTGDGLLAQPPYAPNFDNGIANLQIFLTSYFTGLNLTITNATFNGWSGDALETPEFLCNSTTNEGFQNAGCQDVMTQEGGSTVKHVRWVWPNCLVGRGGVDNGDCLLGAPLDNCLDGTARGPYNISLHEAFRINGTDFYTITDLPIQVTNTIDQQTKLAGTGVRPRCDLRNNPLLNATAVAATQRPPPSQPFIGGSGPQSQQGGSNGSLGDTNGDKNNGTDNSNGDSENDSGDKGTSFGSGSLGSGGNAATRSMSNALSNWHLCVSVGVIASCFSW